MRCCSRAAASAARSGAISWIPSGACSSGGSAARCRHVVAGDFFLLPDEWQREYRPYLAGWFVDRHCERIALLVDEGSFVEDGLFANALHKDLPADGVITGTATVDGRPVALEALEVLLGEMERALAQINQEIARAKTRDALFEKICRLLVEYGGLKMDNYWRLASQPAHDAVI